MLHTLAFLGSVQDWMIILVIVVILFGGKKIPELLRGVGKGVGELQKGLEEGKRAMHETMETERNKTATPEVPAEPTNTTVH